MDKRKTLKIAVGSKSLGDSGFLQFFRVVSSDYGKPREFLFFGSQEKLQVTKIPHPESDIPKISGSSFPPLPFWSPGFAGRKNTHGFEGEGQELLASF